MGAQEWLADPLLEAFPVLEAFPLLEALDET